jgi:predicted Kef-type K+ transport protein
MKGQITLSSLIVIVVVLLLFLVLVPLINGMINTSTAALEAAPNDSTEITVAVMYLIPFVIALGIILTVLNQASPRIEGRARR